MVHKNIINDEAFSRGEYEQAIKNGFAVSDKDLLKAAADANWHSGACVVSTIISKKKLWLGNLGDSEAILARREPTGFKAIELSHKHKPTDPVEKERIKKVGGYVVLGRVMGSLAVARALGDKDFKKPYNNSEGDYVSSEPHLNQIDLTPEDEFLIVSCDGLWYYYCLLFFFFFLYLFFICSLFIAIHYFIYFIYLIVLLFLFCFFKGIVCHMIMQYN